MQVHDQARVADIAGEKVQGAVARHVDFLTEREVRRRGRRVPFEGKGWHAHAVRWRLELQRRLEIESRQGRGRWSRLCGRRLCNWQGGWLRGANRSQRWLGEGSSRGESWRRRQFRA
jgi:hypothetical protein